MPERPQIKDQKLLSLCREANDLEVTGLAFLSVGADRNSASHRVAVIAALPESELLAFLPGGSIENASARTKCWRAASSRIETRSTEVKKVQGTTTD